MKTFRVHLLCALMLLLAACSPLRRGFDGNALVSPARPDVTMEAVGLPMLANGQIYPFMNTNQGFQFPDTLLSVYGTNAAAPMAIVVLSCVPNAGWNWDPLSFSGPQGAETPGVVFGDQEFFGTVRIVNGKSDPFSPLVTQDAASLNWLAQRFAALEDFRQAKLILEYREPLPESLVGATSVPLYDPAVIAFRERAAKAFTVRFGGAPSVGKAPYIKTLNARYLGAFLGSMAPKDVFIPYTD